MTSVDDKMKVPKIDPRIRERRNEVLRSSGRKRLYAIVAIILAFALASGLHLLLRTSIFSVQTINVYGSTHYSKGSIISSSGVILGTPLTEVDPNVVARRLESLPWNATVTVHKKWPSTLNISVSGRFPLVVVSENATTDLLVDSTGRVLTQQSSAMSANWIRLCLSPSIPSSKVLKSKAGCTYQSDSVGSFISAKYRPLLLVASALRSQRVSQISELALSSNGEIDGLLRSGLAVRFGSTNQLQQKIRSLGLILNHASTAGYSTIDVRVPTEPVLSNW